MEYDETLRGVQGISMGYGSAKRQRYLNLFIILRNEELLEEILSKLNSVFTSKGINCHIEVKRSLVVPNFIYIKVMPQESAIDLRDLKSYIDKCLDDVSKGIIWSKVEIIEVK